MKKFGGSSYLDYHIWSGLPYLRQEFQFLTDKTGKNPTNANPIIILLFVIIAMIIMLMVVPDDDKTVSSN